MSTFYREIFSVASDLSKAWLSGKKRVKIALGIGLTAIILITIIVVLVAAKSLPKQPWHSIAGGLGVIVAIIILGISGFQRAIADKEFQEEIDAVKERVREHPTETHAAWELARIKLESYLNRNLNQIRWIFIWTVFIMIIGFIIIGFGILKVYASPDNFEPSIVVTCSGILVELIGTTFLIIYKSTMSQAKDYVNILERINAVGMSVQILENISSKREEIKDQTKAELAKQLLSLYSSIK